MPSNEYLREVTVGNVEELNGKIVLCEYDEFWEEMYLQEREKIESVLNGDYISIEHVGFTSVHDLCAKPILDILLFVKNSAEEYNYVPALEKNGYTLKVRESVWYEHRLLKKIKPQVNLHVFLLDTKKLTECCDLETG